MLKQEGAHVVARRAELAAKAEEIERARAEEVEKAAQELAALVAFEAAAETARAEAAAAKEAAEEAAAAAAKEEVERAAAMAAAVKAAEEEQAAGWMAEADAAAKAAEERAAERAAAREAMIAAVTPVAPPESSAEEGAPSGGALARINLPPLVTDALVAADLQDPTAMSPEDQDNTVAAAAAGLALLFLLPIFEIGLFGDLALSGIFGGGIAAYCALRKDSIGQITRDVGGRTARTTFDTAKKLEREYEVTEKVIDKSKQLIADLKKSL